MSGWVTPTPPGSPRPASGPDGTGPVVGWVTPSEPEGLGIREASGEGWRLTRANLGTFAAIAAVPMVILNLATIPIWLSAGRMFEQMITFFVNLDWARYANDPEGLQRDMQAAMQPVTDLAVLSAVGGGLSFIVWMLGAAALTAATLDAADGRRPSFTSAYRAVAAHAGALVVPALVLGIGYAVIVGALSLGQPGTISRGDVRGAAVSSLLGIAILVLEVGAVYLAIRWAVFFQVVIAEGTGFRGALSRSAK